MVLDIFFGISFMIITCDSNAAQFVVYKLKIFALTDIYLETDRFHHLTSFGFNVIDNNWRRLQRAKDTVHNFPRFLFAARPPTSRWDLCSCAKFRCFWNEKLSTVLQVFLYYISKNIPDVFSAYDINRVLQHYCLSMWSDLVHSLIQLAPSHHWLKVTCHNFGLNIYR